jgi:type IV secretion system protein VirD4
LTELATVDTEPVVLPDPSGLLLGARRRSLESSLPIGYRSDRPAASSAPGLWFDDSEAHALLVAPTGAGKTTWLACQLARHPGSAVVFDPKGELVAMTARRRLELGNQVAVLDPFAVTTNFDLPVGRDRFDPGHWLSGSPTLEDDAMALAAEIHAAPLARDPFWAEAATDLTAAIITHVYEDLPEDERSWAKVADLHFTGDFDMAVAQRLDRAAVRNVMANESLAAYLSHPERETRPSVLSTARAGMRAFHTPRVRGICSSTTFDPSGLITGARPLTIYLVIPPQNIVSHASLVRLWLTAMLRALTVPRRALRRHEPDSDVLFLIDELPGLGRMAMIPMLYAYLRSFGVRAVSIVQSLSQLTAAYGDEARVIIENAGIRAAFGVTDQYQAAALATMLDTTPDRLLALDHDEMAIRTATGTAACRRADHRSTEFVPEDWFDSNPYHGPTVAPGPPVR